MTSDPNQDGSELLSKTPWVRKLYITLGFIFLIIGIVGLFLPVLPTTPFLLISASCFARGSQRFYLWLLNQPHLGPHINDWRKHKSLPLQTKLVAISSLWIGLSSSMYFFVPSAKLKFALALTGMAVTFYLLRIPTREPRL